MPLDTQCMKAVSLRVTQEYSNIGNQSAGSKYYCIPEWKPVQLYATGRDSLTTVQGKSGLCHSAGTQCNRKKRSERREGD